MTSGPVPENPRHLRPKSIVKYRIVGPIHVGVGGGEAGPSEAGPKTPLRPLQTSHQTFPVGRNRLLNLNQSWKRSKTAPRVLAGGMQSGPEEVSVPQVDPGNVFARLNPRGRNRSTDRAHTKPRSAGELLSHAHYRSVNHAPCGALIPRLHPDASPVELANLDMSPAASEPASCHPRQRFHVRCQTGVAMLPSHPIQVNPISTAG